MLGRSSSDVSFTSISALAEKEEEKDVMMPFLGFARSEQPEQREARSSLARSRWQQARHSTTSEASSGE